MSDYYKKRGIAKENFRDFALKVGVTTVLPLSRNYGRYRFNRAELRGCGRLSILCDYCIPYLEDFLKNPSIEKSRLVWKTLKRLCETNNSSDYFHTYYGKRGPLGMSALVYQLKEINWVPQQNGRLVNFVIPRYAEPQKLPQGFEYKTDWVWLKCVEFGEGVEERKEEQLRFQKEVAAFLNRCGLSIEEAKRIGKLRKNYPEEFEKFLKKMKMKETEFPVRSAAPERGANGTDLAQDKTYEERQRRVRTSRSKIDPSVRLKNEYTNDDNQMVCQICKDEMPFKKLDGEYYFEAVEAFTKDILPKEHEAQFLALCPLCAAKYKELVKKDENRLELLKEELLRLEDGKMEIPLQLGEEETSIRFVETHFVDLRELLHAYEEGSTKSTEEAE